MAADTTGQFPEDRALVQALTAKCHELVLARPHVLEGEREPDLEAVGYFVELLKGFFEFRRARCLLEGARRFIEEAILIEVELGIDQKHGSKRLDPTGPILPGPTNVQVCRFNSVYGSPTQDKKRTVS